MGHFDGDIRDADRLGKVFQDSAPEVVFHLAAQSLVREGYRDPVGTIATNVIGTVNLLEAVRRQSSVRAVVVVTSDKCYLNREWLRPYREDDALGGKDPYSASKACAEILSAAWRDSFLARTRSAGHRARRQRHRRRRLGDGSPGAGCPAGMAAGPGTQGEVTIRPSGPGRTCWNPCPAICCWPSSCAKAKRSVHGTSARRRRTH